MAATDPLAGPTPRPPAALPVVVYERTPGAAPAPLTLPYRRREPEKTALYEVVRENLETFLLEGQFANPSGTGSPAFLENEFRRYLDRGQLGRGFARLRCPTCGAERLVAFSADPTPGPPADAADAEPCPAPPPRPPRRRLPWVGAPPPRVR